MSRTTKNTLELVRTALEAAREALPDYAYPRSKHTFTQPQLLAMLCVMEFEKTDYRGMAVKLGHWEELRETLELSSTPHFTTLSKAARRLLGGKSGRRQGSGLLEQFSGAGPGA
jgi:hypothetical protein